MDVMVVALFCVLLWEKVIFWLVGDFVLSLSHRFQVQGSSLQNLFFTEFK